MATSLRVSMPFRSIYYAPLFVAYHLGAFADEGLDVSIEPSPPGGVSEGLMDGSLDVAVGGPMRGLQLADARVGKTLVSFIMVNARSGFFLLSRQPLPNFTWADMKEKVLIEFGEAPTPWFCLQHTLTRHGVDPSAVTVSRHLDSREALERFRAGYGDFIEQPMPNAQHLVDEGLAYEVVAMADVLGPIAFSAYLATPAFLDVRRGSAVAVARAHLAAAAWIRDHSAREVSLLIAPSFPDMDPGLRQAAIDRYKRLGVWPTDGVTSRAEFETLQDVLLSASFIRRRYEYERLVDTSIMQEAALRPGR